MPLQFPTHLNPLILLHPSDQQTLPSLDLLTRNPSWDNNIEGTLYLFIGSKVHCILSDVCPTPLHFKKAKSKSTSAGNSGEEEAEDDSDGEEDDEDWVNEFLVEEAADNEEVDEVEDFEPGDFLGKVLVVITHTFTPS
ncbi:hypothetical protein PAXRUDRAFT_20537 [Paxillus rubicundulus Ve08.2h10]|uniref:Uncharacterized protein n=1 Tax=Paxillus rubicundulus Ve08.2h10 TaxID=930991 RepID=A0A0D0D1H4_9AGAM|nr:hypothetical protein PAXRUDRAFT_20537 [Paxillus rubicundulus Ve08.2h10]